MSNNNEQIKIESKSSNTNIFDNITKNIKDVTDEIGKNINKETKNVTENFNENKEILKKLFNMPTKNKDEKDSGEKEDENKSGEEEDEKDSGEEEDEKDSGEEEDESDENEDENESGEEEVESDEDDKSSDEEEDGDESSDEDEEKYQKLNKNISNNIILNSHPESILHNNDEVYKMTAVSRNKDHIIVDKLHKTIPIMTKYEKTKILGERCKQLQSGAITLVDIDDEEGYLDEYSIAMRELNEKKIPFIIRRPLPNGGSEYWDIRDLELLY